MDAHLRAVSPQDLNALGPNTRENNSRKRLFPIQMGTGWKLIDVQPAAKLPAGWKLKIHVEGSQPAPSTHVSNSKRKINPLLELQRGGFEELS